MIKPDPELLEALRVLGSKPPPREVTVNLHPEAHNDDLFDAMYAAFRVEFDRWAYRRRISAKNLEVYKTNTYELVRNTSPDNNLIGEEFQEIVRLTKRECPDRHAAERWCITYASRAAMRKAIEAM